MKEREGWGEREGLFVLYPPLSPPPQFGSSSTLSLGPAPCPLSPLPPLPYPPSSLCPGAGSRRDTGPDPCPSCPGSACSELSGPEGQAEAQTPGVHPLPRVEMRLSPPSGWGHSMYQPTALAPLPSAGPRSRDTGRVGRTTHRFLCGKRTDGPATVGWAPHTSPAAQQPTIGGSGERGAFFFA